MNIFCSRSQSQLSKMSVCQCILIGTIVHVIVDVGHLGLWRMGARLLTFQVRCGHAPKWWIYFSTSCLRRFLQNLNDILNNNEVNKLYTLHICVVYWPYAKLIWNKSTMSILSLKLKILYCINFGRTQDDIYS